MDKEQKNIHTGAGIFMESLVAEGIDTIFGYPGGAIMPVYDTLYDYSDKLHHVLVRHEQGAVHAAQGYARATGKTGVVLVTSGPGATNVLTGILDAKMDSTPLVVITGQVPSTSLGTDAFQEADMIGLTSPICKWNYQIRKAEDVQWAVKRAFYIAASGRPGPVVLDFTRDAQKGLAEMKPYVKCKFIRSYIAVPKMDQRDIDKAVRVIDGAKRPLVVFGQGVILSDAAAELREFIEKGDIPAASTLLGLSALPTGHRLYQGMIGMHGNVAANVKTNECDVLIAVGMRFDDRVTGTADTYARQAKIIHIDIDPTEIGKVIPADIGILSDARTALSTLTAKMRKNEHSEWIESFRFCREVEEKKVIAPAIRPENGFIRMGEVVDTVADVSGGKAVIVTDVGQNQMLAARYSRFCDSRSFISSGGLGTMGFGLPAAIGAKIGAPEKTVCLFSGDGGIQMTIEELGTIMQEGTGVKIVLLNNNWLGNVRQWQGLFFDRRYSQTRMLNPDYSDIAKAYGIKYLLTQERGNLREAVKEMLSDDAPCLLEVRVLEDENVMPMIPPGKGVTEVMLNENEWYNGK